MQIKKIFFYKNRTKNGYRLLKFHIVYINEWRNIKSLVHLIGAPYWRQMDRFKNSVPYRRQMVYDREACILEGHAQNPSK